MLPKFHTTGQPRGDFYVLTYVDGFHAPTNKRSREKAALVINYSPSTLFTRYSFNIISANGRMLAYTRGPEACDTVEMALLTAWCRYGIQPFQWKLFPKKEITVDHFANKARHSRQYHQARKGLCFLLSKFRLGAWLKTPQAAKRFKFKYPTPPQFQIIGSSSVPDPYKSNDENLEILESACEYLKQQKAN